MLYKECIVCLMIRLLPKWKASLPIIITMLAKQGTGILIEKALSKWI